MILSFTDWWSQQVNPAWRNFMETSKQSEYFRNGYEGALKQMPEQTTQIQELQTENTHITEKLVKANERIALLEKHLRKLEEPVKRITTLLAHVTNEDQCTNDGP